MAIPLDLATLRTLVPSDAKWEQLTSALRRGGQVIADAATAAGAERARADARAEVSIAELTSMILEHYRAIRRPLPTVEEVRALALGALREGGGGRSV